MIGDDACPRASNARSGDAAGLKMTVVGFSRCCVVERRVGRIELFEVVP